MARRVQKTKQDLIISVTCIDEMLAPREHYFTFRLPGANLFPRANEPAYPLAAILLYAQLYKNLNVIQIVLADHGLLTSAGFIGCGMVNIEESLGILEPKVTKNTSLNKAQIHTYLSRLALYDIQKQGGIGKHAKWEVEQLERICPKVELLPKLGKILPNDKAKEAIVNERLIITHPIVNQKRLLQNALSEGKVFDGSSIIQTVIGEPNIEQDYQLTNGLLMAAFEKGETVKEVLVLKPAVETIQLTVRKTLIQKVQQTMDFTLKRISQLIAPYVNLSTEESYRYLLSIKKEAEIALFGNPNEQLQLAANFAKKIQSLGLLPKNMTIMYGVVTIDGDIKVLKALK